MLNETKCWRLRQNPEGRGQNFILTSRPVWLETSLNYPIAANANFSPPCGIYQHSCVTVIKHTW